MCSGNLIEVRLWQKKGPPEGGPFPWNELDYEIQIFANTGAMRSAKIDTILIKMLRDGPEVSLNGSPTVSPTTAAL